MTYGGLICYITTFWKDELKPLVCLVEETEMGCSMSLAEADFGRFVADFAESRL